MKKIAIIVSDVIRPFKMRRINAILQKIKELEADINLYIFRSLYIPCMNEDYNTGEYNMFRLPDFSEFDGIIIDLNNIKNDNSNPSGVRAMNHVLEKLRESGKPVISIANDLRDFYFVGIDNYSSMQSMIAHLYDKHKCRNFWFIMGAKGYYEVQNRVQALCDYMDEHGIPYDDNDFYYENYEYECGQHGFETLLSTHKHLPDAIICANDIIAIGLCETACEKGYHIPDDFLVTGFDNNKKASIYTPGISTVNQTAGDTGREALNIMLRLWNGDKVSHTNLAKTTCIFRSSCGCNSTQEKVLQTYINKQVHFDASDTEYSEQMKSLNYDLVHCTSVFDICRLVTERISVIQDISLYLILDKHICEFSYSTDIWEYLMDSSEQFTIEGYPECMDLVFAYEDGNIKDLSSHEITGLFPTFESKVGGTDFTFIPLHFGKYTVGYFVVKNGLHLMDNRYLINVLNTLSTTIENFYYKERMKYSNEMLSRLYIRDSMTGLYNRLGYQKIALDLFYRQKAKNKNLTILFIDMDRLKFINDNYGHEYGDFAIKIISSAIFHHSEDDAVAVRWGGDEFLLIMPYVSQDKLENIKNDIHTVISDNARKMQLPCELTVSIGSVNTDVTTNKSLDDYVQEADEKMYEVKQRKKASQIY